MAVTTPTYSFLSPTQIRFSYSSDLTDPTFYIYINGEFVTDTLETTYDQTVAIGGQVQFEVFDDPDDEPTEYYPDQLRLRWMGRDGAQAYRVEQYIASAWTFQALVPYRLSNLYSYNTAPLEDVTTYQYRVLPLDVEGRTGTALTFTVEMARYPDAPSQTMTFASGELSIT